MTQLNYTFTLEPDPDDSEGEGFYSVFIDNGHGCSAEIAGKIGTYAFGEHIVAHLRTLPQDVIRTVFGATGET